MITWGVNSYGEKTVFCMECREAFGTSTDHVDVLDLKSKAEAEHQCKKVEA